MNRQYPMFFAAYILSVFFATTCRADTVLHLSFDDAVSESGVSVKSGNAVYSTDTPGPQVFWLIDGVERAKRANTKSLSMNCASLDLLFEDERLMAPNLLNATIEFFIKGISAKTWECPLSISAGGQPYPLLVQAWDNGRYYFRADTYSTTVNQHAINSDCRYNDGSWHHIAMTVSAIEGGVSEIRFYADYVLVRSALTTISSWQGFTKDMFLRIGAANSNYLIDEFRVSDTFLQPESFLKLEPEARDGDTLLHLSFDNGDFNSLARPTESPSLISGTPSFSDDVPHAVIWTEEGKVSRSNNKSFRAANNAITLKIPENNLIKTQSLLKPNLNEMTFEFFYKAISASGSWPLVFHLGGSAGQYLLQVNGSARCRYDSKLQ